MSHCTNSDIDNGTVNFLIVIKYKGHPSEKASQFTVPLKSIYNKIVFFEHCIKVNKQMLKTTNMYVFSELPSISNMYLNRYNS
jgi:hypothetical protein